MLKQLATLCCVFLFCLTGCEETDLRLASEAGLDAVKAATLSDATVQDLARQASTYSDSKHQVAAAGNRYAARLQRLVGHQAHEDGRSFSYKVYLADEVNAFAMADGSIRIYSGLMDMLDDDELRFVIGHEMGHVAKEHMRKKMQLAYAARAVRKGIASQTGVVGEFARSQVGGFSELLMGAQFSQLEEKEADDYGLSFLKKRGYEPAAAIAALRKLATLGDKHSFLASHPAPGKRAARLESQLAGKSTSMEESQQNVRNRVMDFLERQFPALYEKLCDFFPWLQG
ncbi:MAG: peptidase M48 [Deltaproteobacteria bacterium RIFOXYD12_FULL_57_12]|nr:MAG: peptidase M48 [Deltaproteobacteria bacterium RIFOXYD12_FULL_57_12]